ncbi:unnamed protein product [Clonostachys rhizophaga]|uniref:LTD domain-containing protein n=1 Tax=Clonostachys rhizophaga TaxID=160324 RepID=A0A9N9VRE4_9HYPO|nr:unnamed protein product [Clonostachys rhizophaga]
MGLKAYGVWKATPTKFTVQTASEDAVSPHGHLTFQDGVSTKKLSSAINIKSLSPDSRLVYWLIQDFKHPLTAKLKSLSPGFQRISRDQHDIALDILRSNVVNVLDGSVVPHDLPGDKNDIIDFIKPFFDNAIQKKATVYIYGEQFPGKDGLHDVHMNQGSGGRFRSSNGIYQDGSVIMEFADGHWEAFFIAFASQTAETDDRGQPEGPTLGEVLGNNSQPGGGHGKPSDDGKKPIDDGETPSRPSNAVVAIAAALVNPDGPDGGENPEIVHVVNNGLSSVALKGWTIENQMGNSFAIPDSSVLKVQGDKEGFNVEGVPLSNKGGSIILKNAAKQVVDRVSYTKTQASQSGALLYFR